ncbi:hypothetical protein IT568_10930 [bacterium]|nr:hypothetical protein [bacterium]
MNFLLTILIILSFSTLQAEETGKFEFKIGQPSNIDGKIFEQEWSDARFFQVPLHSNSRALVYYKTDGEFFYFAFEIFEKAVVDSGFSEVRIWISLDEKTKNNFPKETELEFRLQASKNDKVTETFGNGISYFSTEQKGSVAKNWQAKSNLIFPQKWTCEFAIRREKLSYKNKIPENVKVGFYFHGKNQKGDCETAFPGFSPKKWLSVKINE